MREYAPSWISSAFSDSTINNDSTKQYDSTAGGHIFIEDWLGPCTLWVEPKLDWNSSDFYNFDDLDSVENNTLHVASMLKDYGAGTIDLVAITNRTIKRIEFYDSLNRIESNIQLLADKLYTPVGWQTPKTSWLSGHRFDWRDAIRLEKNVYLLYDLLLKVVESMKYCGTFACGEDGI